MSCRKADTLGDWVADHFGIDGFRSFEELTEAERTFVAVWELYAAVCDGGFPSYYYNSGADHSDVVVGACREVGAIEVADLVSKANGVFPDGQPATDSEERAVQYEELIRDDDEDDDVPWPKVWDERFFELEDSLLSSLYDFVLEHRSEIRRADNLVPVNTN